jgi:hypothetical protein
VKIEAAIMFLGKVGHDRAFASLVCAACALSLLAWMVPRSI